MQCIASSVPPRTPHRTPATGRRRDSPTCLRTLQSAPCLTRCRPSPCSRLSRPRSTTATPPRLPTSVSNAPIHLALPGKQGRTGLRNRRFPRSLIFDRRARHPALPLRHRHGYAVDLHRDPRPDLWHPPRSSPTPPHQKHVCAGLGAHRLPAHIRPGWSWSAFQEASHRFLAYAISSRSPSPTHPAVLSRPDFVAAAPTIPGVLRIKLPPASPHRYDSDATKVSHLHSNNQRLAAHHRWNDMPWMR